jgi:hypothetical protein
VAPMSGSSGWHQDHRVSSSVKQRVGAIAGFECGERSLPAHSSRRLCLSNRIYGRHGQPECWTDWGTMVEAEACESGHVSRAGAAFCARCGEPLPPGLDVPPDPTGDTSDATSPASPAASADQGLPPAPLTQTTPHTLPAALTKSILKGCGIVAASILVGFLLLGLMLRGHAVESQPYRDGYDAGYGASQEGTEEQVCSGEGLSVGDRQHPTPKEAADWTAGCKDGYEAS